VIASVGPEAEFELTDGAAFYAREATADLGLAFISEFERTPGPLVRIPGAWSTLAWARKANATPSLPL